MTGIEFVAGCHVQCSGNLQLSSQQMQHPLCVRSGRCYPRSTLLFMKQVLGGSNALLLHE